MNTASTQLLGAQQTPDSFESQSWNWHLTPEPKIPSGPSCYIFMDFSDEISQGSSLYTQSIR